MIKDKVRGALGTFGKKVGGFADRIGSKLSKVGGIGSLASIPLMATGVGELSAPVFGAMYGVGKGLGWVGSALK